MRLLSYEEDSALQSLPRPVPRSALQKSIPVLLKVIPAHLMPFSENQGVCLHLVLYYYVC